MEWLLIYFLFGSHMVSFHFVMSVFTASACYGVSGNCYYIQLNCGPNGRIHIREANYLFDDRGVCKQSDLTCEGKMRHSCCDSKSGNTRIPFKRKDMTKLKKMCSDKPECSSQAPWTNKPDSNPVETSSMVEVQYDCPNGSGYAGTDTTIRPEPLAESDNGNTAAIVVPIVVVLLIGVVAAVVFLYWRRKQQLESGRKHEGQADYNGHAPVQNPGYFDTDKVTESAKDIKDGDLGAEDTYHIIDPNSIPDRAPAVPNEYLVLDPPEDEYNTIDPNNVDTKTGTSSEYFILEPGAQNTYNDASNSIECDYNKINLKEHEIVKDPNYQRLATVDQNSKVEANLDIENYAHLGDKLADKAKGGDTEAGDMKNDDYAHLSKKSI